MKIPALPFTVTATRSNLLQRINAGEVTSAPPKVVPAGTVTVDQAVNAILPAGAPASLLDLLRKYPWLPWLVLGLAILLAIILFFVLGPVAGIAAAVAVIGAGIFLFRLLRSGAAGEQASQTLSQAGQTAASVAAYPPSSNFVLSTPGSSFVPTLGGVNSPTGVRFDTALTQSFQLIAVGNLAAQHPAPVGCPVAAYPRQSARQRQICRPVVLLRPNCPLSQHPVNRCLVVLRLY